MTAPLHEFAALQSRMQPPLAAGLLPQLMHAPGVAALQKKLAWQWEFSPRQSVSHKVPLHTWLLQEVGACEAQLCPAVQSAAGNCLF